ncbi:MAG TPA: hypothetical protein GX504_02410 [Clostridia bacterium]|nr:hypothetical protein [Clostridia bacterium]
MLFGPRKSGFAREEVVTAFDAEVREPMPDKAPPPRIVGEAPAPEPEPPDLLDLLEIPAEEAPVPAEEKTRAQLLADFIRERSMGAQLTSKKLLAGEEENLEELLQAVKEDESCSDIVSVKGDKDEYFYSNRYMSDNFAMIAALVEEKNLPKTIAHMVRWNCKTYPTPTPLRYFMASPYYYTEPQINRALDVIKQREEYRDIQEITTGNNVRYLYSTLHMSERYARALAEQAEYGEFGY